MSANLLPLQLSLQVLRIKYQPKPLLYASCIILSVSSILLGLSVAALNQCQQQLLFAVEREDGQKSRLEMSGVLLFSVMCACSLVCVMCMVYARTSKRALSVRDMRVFTFYLGLVACSSLAWGASVLRLVSNCMFLQSASVLSIILGCVLSVGVIGKVWKRAYFICLVFVYYGARRVVWVIYKALCWKNKGKFLYVCDEGGEKTTTIETERPQVEGSVRFVCVSDTHLRHWEVNVPRGNVFLHAGDILQYDRGTSVEVRGRNDGEKTLTDFNEWLGTLKDFTHRLVVAGNHDRFLHELGADRVRRILTNATYLCDDWAELTFPESVTSGKVSIFGSPMSAGRSDNCAFQLSREEMNLRLQSLLTRHADILLTHSMPFPLEESPGTPRYHVCGHVHGAHGAHFRSRSSGSDYTIVNGAICNHHYCPSHIPVLFDFVPSKLTDS